MQRSSSAAIALTQVNRATVLAPTVLVFAVVAAARIVYVSLYAAPLPYWDQWDEIALQIEPWFAGTWHLLQLFVPHVQHRVAFTRLVSFFLAGINNHVFDNLVEAYANTFTYAIMWSFACSLLTHRDTSRARPWLIAVAVIILGALPFDWENTLIGFQNAFYFMEMLAIVVIGVAAYRTLSIKTIVLLAILATASLFTMAPGLLAAPAACFALLLCAWRKPEQWTRLLSACVIMALVTIAGLVLLELAPAVASLRATGVAGYLRSLLVPLTWPLQDQPHPQIRWLFAVALWAPSAIWLWLFYRTRRADRSEIFAASLAGWVFLQCLAIAYSRGHDMQSLPSRYSEILALGIAANAWLALKLASNRPHVRWEWAIIGAAVVLVGCVFWQRTPNDFAAMRQRHVFTTIETHNVKRYLAGVPLPVLPVNSQDIPYPLATRLRYLLDNPQIRRLLPPSAFPAADPGRHAPLSYFAAMAQASIRAWFPKRTWAVSANQFAMVAPSTFVPYHLPLPANPHNTQCSLDAIDGKPSTSAASVLPDSAVTFGGWMSNGHAQAVDRGSFILKGANQSYSATFATGVIRPDVAKALHSKDMDRSGYNLTVTLKNVAAGTYALFATDPTDPSALCDLHRTLTVR